MIVSRASAQKFLGKELKGLGAGRRSYYVLSADGLKNLGGPYTKDQAKQRIREVEYFKRNPSNRALYIQPNQASIKVAKRILRNRKTLPKSRRGGLDAIEAHEAGVGSGVLRARDIAAGKRIDAYRVLAFFQRHRGNYLDAKLSGKTWKDSKVIQAWDLWGGDPLYKQVKAAVEKDKKMRAKKKSSRKKNPSQKGRRHQASPAEGAAIGAAVGGVAGHFISPVMSPVGAAAGGYVGAKAAKNGRRRNRTENPSPTFIYVTAKKGDRIELFKFDASCSPCAGRAAMALMLAKKQEGSDAKVHKGDAALRRHLKTKSGQGRIIAGSHRIPNPRNSIVKDALASEAVRYNAFPDFARAYWESCARGLFWYPTDEKKFHIGDPERSLIAKGKFHVYCSPALALKAVPDTKYLAEIDATRLAKKDLRPRDTNAGERIAVLGGAGSLKVLRVLEPSKARKAQRWQESVLPSSRDGLRLVWDKAWEKKKKESEKAKTQREKKLEREAIRTLRQQKREAERAAREEKAEKKKKAEAKKKRISRGKAAQAAKAAARGASGPSKKTAKKTAKKAAKAAARGASGPSKKTAKKTAKKTTRKKTARTLTPSELKAHKAKNKNNKAKKQP